MYHAPLLKILLRSKLRGSDRRRPSWWSPHQVLHRAPHCYCLHLCCQIPAHRQLYLLHHIRVAAVPHWCLQAVMACCGKGGWLPL